MNISGTISEAQPVDSGDNMGNKYQWITIQTPTGSVVGRIGSKQGYAAGGQISVTVEQKQGDAGSYNYFKKFNPQYSTAPQNAPQAPSQPVRQSNTNKDRLIVAQVVYKVLGELSVGMLMGDFDVWLMGNQNVFKRHVDLIMQIGEGKTPMQINNPAPPLRHQTEPDAPEPDEFDQAMEKPY